MDFHWFTLRSHRVLAPLAVVALTSMVWVEQGRHVSPNPHYEPMLQAAKTASAASRYIRELRLERGVFVDQINDPAQTAMIGQEYTQITTDRGNLEAKIAGTDPNFAAVVVSMLEEFGLEKGDRVAIGMTGSFPALNIAVLAAIDAMGLEGVTVSSIGASNYGANDPYFTWLDMERELVDAGILSRTSAAASPGGGNDQGRGLSPMGRTLLREAAARNKVPMIVEDSLEASILRRMQIYEDGAPKPVAAYINVGGGVASLGHSLNSDLIPNGPSELVPLRNFPYRGVLLRMNERGIPVIHLLNIRRLQARYGLAPIVDRLPEPGEGKVYGQEGYSLWKTLTATLVLVFLCSGLYLADRNIHQLGKKPAEDIS